MIRTAGAICLFILCAVVCDHAQVAPSLPAAVRTVILNNKCSNQPSIERGSVAGGNFAAPNQMDWVIYCIVPDPFGEKDLGLVLFMWGGSHQCAPEPLAINLDTRGSWRVTRHAISRITQMQSPISKPHHDGIEIESADLGSTAIHYCDNGKWVIGDDVSAEQRRRIAETRRAGLPPSAFPQLPAWVRRSMEADGCHVPPPYGAAKSDNVVAGSFAITGQRDWAALCSGRGIRVYWGGPSRCPTLQDGGDNIFVASPTRMRDSAESFEVKVPRFTHQGIESGDEKTASIAYCDSGKWIRFLSAD